MKTKLNDIIADLLHYGRIIVSENVGNKRYYIIEYMNERYLLKKKAGQVVRIEIL